MSKNEELLKNENILQSITKMIFPVMITMVVMILYNMADTFFVGKTGNAWMVSSIALIGPVYSILMGIAQLIGAGGCNKGAISLGEKDYGSIKKIIAFCTYAVLSIGSVFALVVCLFKTQIAYAIGADASTIEYASDYLMILSLGAPFIMYSSAFANIVRGFGATKESMIGNFLGTIVNIVLDPILILLFNLGVKGAAIATVIGNVVSVLYFTQYIAKNEELKFSVSLHIPSLKQGFDIIVLGIPSCLTTLVNALAMLLMNHILVSYSNQALAAYNIAGKIPMIISMLVMGIAMGVQPLFAYNFGAKNQKKVNEILRYTTIIIMGFSIICVVFGIAFKEKLVQMFISDAEIVALGKVFVSALILGTPFSGIYQLGISYLQATNNAKKAIALSFVRQGVVFVIFMFTFNLLFGLNGVIYSQPCADVIAMLISLVLLFKTNLREVEKKKREFAMS